MCPHLTYHVFLAGVLCIYTPGGSTCVACPYFLIRLLRYSNVSRGFVESRSQPKLIKPLFPVL
jgi:hypothetical protein